VFTPGSVHRATITEKSERGAVLELPYGIEGFAYPKSLVKEDGSSAENGEALDFRVTEFSEGRPSHRALAHGHLQQRKPQLRTTAAPPSSTKRQHKAGEPRVKAQSST
jgi:small subunit ribosomal protein S1